MFNKHIITILLILLLLLSYYTSRYGLIVYVDWIDDQGYGRIKYEIEDREDKEIIHIFTYANLYMDLPSIEEAKLEARKISIDWIGQYLRIRFPKLYDYLNTNGFVIENVTSFWQYLVSSGVNPDYTSIEARESLLNKYRVLVTSRNLEIDLLIDVVDKYVETYSIEMDAPRNVVEEVFGENISAIWNDDAYWVRKIKDLGVELREKRVGSDAYFWNNTERGFQEEIIYVSEVNSVPLARFEVHHLNKSSLLVRTGMVPEVMYNLVDYYATVNIEYYRGYAVHVSYWNDLSRLYHELYKVRDELRKLRENTAISKDDYPQIRDKAAVILSKIGEYRITGVEFKYVLYSGSFTPAYLVNGNITVRNQPYVFTLIIFPLQKTHYIDMIRDLGCLCLKEQENNRLDKIHFPPNLEPSALDNATENNNYINVTNTTRQETKEYMDSMFLLMAALVLTSILLIGLLLLTLSKYK